MKNNDLVFVVDDNPMITMLVEEILRAGGFDNVETFLDPASVLEQIHHAKMPVVVITDYRMPKMNGIELLESIDREFHTINSVIITVDPTEVRQNALKKYKVIDKTNNLKDELICFMMQVTEEQLVPAH